MSPRQKTALKNRAQGDLPAGESDAFHNGPDDGSSSTKSTASPALAVKQRRKKRGIPKSAEFGDISDERKNSREITSPSPTPFNPAPLQNPSTIDSSVTSSKEFIDALTDGGGRNALQLVSKAKGRSQQLTFDALIKGATKLELCSLKAAPDQERGNQGKKEAGTSVSTAEDSKVAKKKRKKNSLQIPTPITTNDAVEKMESALKGLGKLEGDVMNALFPTDGSLPQSYELIANRFGMTVEEVKGIADNALRGLRGVKGPNGRISTVWN